MHCPTCYGGTEPQSPCVCATEEELAHTPEITLDERWLLAPLDTRNEFTHPEDFMPHSWAERYES